MQFLERLKSKQSHVKSQIAFMSAIVTTGIIALVWLSTLPAQFSKVGEQIAKEGEAQTATAGNAIDDLIAGATLGMDTLEEETSDMEVVAESPQQPTQDSALSELAGWRTSAEMDSFSPSSTTPEQSFVVKEESTPIPTPTPTPTPTTKPAQPAVTPTPTQPTVSETEISPTPTVILIGTTTKKTE